MGTYHSAAALAHAHERKFGLIKKAFRVRKKEQATKTADFMRKMVSGTITTKELARRGHPFGRGRGRFTVTASHGGVRQKFRVRHRKPRIPTPHLPYNEQSGRLKRSLRTISEMGGASYRIQFTAPYAFTLGPTKNTIDRGYRKAVNAYCTSLNRQTTYDMRLDALRIQYGT